MKRRLLLLLAVLAAGALVRAQALLRYDGTFSNDTPVFISMADNLRYGLGWQDPAAERRFLANPLAYRSAPAADPARLTRFGFNDYGLSLIYWAAIHLFANAAAPPILLLWLQVLVDCLDIMLVFWIGRRLGGDALGLLAAALYAGYPPVVALAATHPYYFFWQEAFALWNLGFMLLVLDDGFARWGWGRRLAVGLAWGAVLGMACVTRPTFYLVAPAAAVLVFWRWRREWRRAAAVLAVVLAVEAACIAPVVRLSWMEFHRLRPPRPFWHMVYIGIGAHPNPYGIRFDDQCGFDFGHAHGVKFGAPGWEPRYEQVLRREVMRIRREHPWLLYRNFALNLLAGFTADYNGQRFSWPGGLTLALPASAVLRALLLLLGLVVLWRSGWAGVAVAGQGAYFVVTLCAIIPPFGDYNSCYLPTYVLLVAATGAGAYHVGRRWLLDPAAEIPLGSMLALAGAAGGALCWLAGSAPERLADVLAAPLAGWMLDRALRASAAVSSAEDGRNAAAWARGARAAALAWMGLVGVGAFVAGAAPAGLVGRYLAHAQVGPVWVGMAAVVAALETGLSPWLLGGALALASRFHPETAFAPLLLVTLTGRSVEWRRLRGMAAAAALATGAAALLTHVPPSAWIVPAVFWAAAPVLGRAPGVLRAALAAALFILQFPGFTAWPTLTLALLAGWLWERRA